ncbi:MAG: hypothetical protein KAR36_01930, partial [Candidatus Latescibacteria bacterium]|nr:hypothetical protein [Candidatus Latescibacterota bacterium]
MKRGAVFATFVVLMVLCEMSWGHEPPGIVYYIGGISETNIPALEPSVMVSIPDTSGISGSQVIVPVEITDVTGLEVYGAEVTLTYDGAVLDADSVYGGPVASDLAVTYNVNEEGITRVILAGGSVPLSGSGPLVYVVFNVIGEPGSSTMVQVADVWINEGDPTAVGIPGMFTVMAGLSGIVTDEGAALPIEGAVVQAWDSYPDGSVLVSDTTDGSGSYALSVDAGVYDVRAYAYTYVEVSGMLEGGMDFSSVYYPRVAEDVSAPAMDVHFGLEPVPEVTGTPHVCDYYGELATFEGYPLQLGDVVQAMDPNGIFCGRTVVWHDVGDYAVHVAGDDPESPADEGADPGDPIEFFLNKAYPDTSVAPLWAESGSWQYDAGFTQSTVQEIPMDAGWNLFSFHVEPLNDSLEVMLDPSLGDRYDYVGGYVNGQWDTWKRGRPDFANDLKVLCPEQGYWIELSAADVFLVSGIRVPPDRSIPVDAGWNLVSYLPLRCDSLEHAFTSLDDHHDYVAGYVGGQWDTWKRGRPDFANDLKVLCPGQGYWLNMNTPDVLIYPAEGVLREDVAKPVVFDQDGSASRGMATRWIADFWGWNEESLVEGRPLRMGDVITVIDPDGVLCGATVVSDERGYVVHVYGDERAATPGVDEGAEEGDGLIFYVNGCRAQVTSGSAVWTLWGSEELTLKALTASPEALVPERTALGQNHPNPFNPTTT